MARKSNAEKKEDEVYERTSPPGEVIYQAIYAEGEHELHRNTTGLALSGLAAGSSMGFSMVGEALLRQHLPEAQWRRFFWSRRARCRSANVCRTT